MDPNSDAIEPAAVLSALDPAQGRQQGEEPDENPDMFHFASIPRWSLARGRAAAATK
jgi:hypothetical protein